MTCLSSAELVSSHVARGFNILNLKRSWATNTKGSSGPSSASMHVHFQDLYFNN